MTTRTLLGLLLIGFTTSAYAGQVVRWVDENGVTQFTDPKFAPNAEVVEIAKANGMDVPQQVKQVRSRGGSFVKINKAAKKNKRGWRGYEGRSTAYSSAGTRRSR